MARWGLFFSLIVIIIALFLGSGIFTYYPGSSHWETKDAGFFTGLIHGVIAPIMLALAIFTDYNMYEINNIGWFYDFGFIVGILLIWGGGQTTKNVVRNYYSNKMTEEDHKNIGKLIEEKISEKIKSIKPGSSDEKGQLIQNKSEKNKAEVVEKKMPSGSVSSKDKKARGK
ncbi:hypothetical protein J4477_02965 [Candidatus Pacearchaeota archaeon]|nr:hypothetical protein [Candidatus Pacearchaeota archaeon]